MIIQIIGLLAFIFLFISFYQKKKELILFLQIFSNSLYSVHYFLLNAVSGYTVSIVGLLRSLLFVLKERYNSKILKSNFILFMLIIIYVILGTVFYDGILSLLPVIASIIYTSVYFQSLSLKELRYGALINSFLWLIYNVFVYSYIGIISELILVILNIVLLIKKR